MTFSIITATYNCAETIERAMRSVMIQDKTDFEHIIIDNCSSDKTLDIVKNFQGKHQYLKVVSEPDNGIYDAFNKGLTLASGDIIAFLNADDYYLENTFSKVEKAFQEFPEFSCIHGNIKVKDRTIPPYHGVLSFNNTRMWHPATFMHRKIFAEVGDFNTFYEITADLDLFMKSQNKFRFKYIDETLTVFSLGGISTQKRFQTCKEIRLILRRNGYSFLFAWSVFIYETVKNFISSVLK